MDTISSGKASLLASDEHDQSSEKVAHGVDVGGDRTQ